MQHLQSACASLREKDATIAKLEREKKELKLLNDVANLTIDDNNDNPLVKERAELLNKLEQLEKTNSDLTQELQKANEIQSNDLKVT